MALATGTRAGEILAPRWRDIYLERRLIHIRATISRDGDDDAESIVERVKRGRDARWRSGRRWWMHCAFTRFDHQSVGLHRQPGRTMGLCSTAVTVIDSINSGGNASTGFFADGPWCSPSHTTVSATILRR